LRTTVVVTIPPPLLKPAKTHEILDAFSKQLRARRHEWGIGGRNRLLSGRRGLRVSLTGGTAVEGFH
jgi:hypothetical protein